MTIVTRLQALVGRRDERRSALDATCTEPTETTSGRGWEQAA
jgi:hypothetical protein